MDIIKLARADHWPALKGPEELFSPAGLSIKAISACTMYTPFLVIRLEHTGKWKTGWGQAEVCIKQTHCLSGQEALIPWSLKQILLRRPAALVTVWSCEMPLTPSEAEVPLQPVDSWLTSVTAALRSCWGKSWCLRQWWTLSLAWRGQWEDGTSLNSTWGHHCRVPGEGTWKTAFSPSELLPAVAIILPMCPHIFFCYPENHTGDKHIHTWGKSDKGKFLRRIVNNTQGSVYFSGEPGFPHPSQMQVGNGVQHSLSSNIWSSVEVNKTQIKDQDFHSPSRLLIKTTDTYKRQRQQPS